MTYRLYICGPMTGLPNENRPAFAAAELKLRAAGYDVFNPASQPDVPGWQTADYLIERDLPALRRCHGVALLPGWQRSFGACIEVDLASDLGMYRCEVAWWLDMAEEKDFALCMEWQVSRVTGLPPETCGLDLYDYGTKCETDCGEKVWLDDCDQWNYCPACGRKLRTTP